MQDIRRLSLTVCRCIRFQLVIDVAGGQGLFGNIRRRKDRRDPKLSVQIGKARLVLACEVWRRWAAKTRKVNIASAHDAQYARGATLRAERRPIHPPCVPRNAVITCSLLWSCAACFLAKLGGTLARRIGPTSALRTAHQAPMESCARRQLPQPALLTRFLKVFGCSYRAIQHFQPFRGLHRAMPRLTCSSSCAWVA